VSIAAEMFCLACLSVPQASVTRLTRVHNCCLRQMRRETCGGAWPKMRV